MISRSLTTVFAYLIIANVCFAGFWDPLKFWEDKRVDTLLVAGNYTRSRLLAELIQKENESPILLISPESSPKHFYYIADDKNATKYDIKRLEEFYQFVNPKATVVIGGEKYVGEKVIKMLDRNSAAHITFTSSNWASNARAAEKHFDISGLVKDFERLNLRIYQQNPEATALDTLEEETPVALEEVAEEAPIVTDEAPTVEEPEILLPEGDDQPELEVIEQVPQK